MKSLVSASFSLQSTSGISDTRRPFAYDAQAMTPCFGATSLDDAAGSPMLDQAPARTGTACGAARRNRPSATIGKMITDNSPAATSADAFVLVSSSSSTPMRVAATMNGSDVD